MAESDAYLICFSNSPREITNLGMDDCACPADGLALDAIPPLNDEDRLQAVRMFLLPLDDEHAVGYSPFVTAARYC